MTELFKKELKLSVPKPLWLFALLSAMTLIPQYPLIVGVGYCFLAIFIAFQYMRENKDLEFCLVLPISRKNIAAAKTMTVLALETAQILVAIPCALIAAKVISPQGNIVGMDPNPAFFGIFIAGYGIFNLIFLPWFFSKGYKHGLATLTGVAAFVVFYVICELGVQFIPALKTNLDTLDGHYLGIQFAVAAAGIAVCAVLTFAAYRLSVKKFQNVNL